MTRHLSVPVKSVCAFSILLSATALSGVPAFAANDDVIDGLPTARACAQLGFSTIDDDEDEAGRTRSGGGGLLQKLAPSLGLAAPESIAPPSPAPTGTVSRNVAAAEAGDAYYDQPVNTEKYPDATSNPIKQVADEPVSTFSIDVDTASYANVRRFLNDGTLPPRDAVRVEELINYFDYGYALPTSPDTPFAVHATLTPSPWAPGTEIIHIGLQGYDIAPRRPAAAQPRLPDRRLRLDGRPGQAAAGAEVAERADRPASARGPGVARRLCRRGRRGARADRRQSRS